jgi:adhesin/invasin
VSAHVAGISPVTFSATSSTGTVSQLKIASGDAQTNVVGTALPLPMVVLAQDAHGNASANVPITFAIASGAGQLSTTTAMTDANGHAQTTLTLGTIVAANTVTARAAGITTTLTFTAQSVAGALWKIAIVSGNNQSATVGTSLAAPLVVRIQDMYNNPISGTTVTFSASVGGGTVTVPITTTNILGQADTNLALSQTVGLTDVTASASGVGVIFVVTRSHGAAQKVLPTSGSNQSAAIGSTFAQPLVVTVQDTYGNPVPGATISFSVSVLDATPQSAPVITDSQGRGSCTLTAGSQFNVTYSVTAALGTISTVFTESNLI